MSSSTLAPPRDRDKSEADAVAAGSRWRTWIAATLVVVVALWAAARQVQRAADLVVSGPTLRADALDRYRALASGLPRSGPSVEVFEGASIPFVGYLTDPAAFARDEEGDEVGAAAQRARTDLAAFRFGLAQQALAPRMVVLPGSPFYGAVRFVVGDFPSAAAVPADDEMEMTTVWSDGTGLVLWRRP